MNNPLSSFRAIIAAWPSATALADDLNVSRHNSVPGYEPNIVSPISVRAWKRRDSIPPEFWHDLCVTAKPRGIEVSLTRLAVIARLKGFTKTVGS